MRHVLIEYDAQMHTQRRVSSLVSPKTQERMGGPDLRIKNRAVAAEQRVKIHAHHLRPVLCEKLLGGRECVRCEARHRHVAHFADELQRARLPARGRLAAPAVERVVGIGARVVLSLGRGRRRVR